ncbi:MAG: NifB/NifX family molybdenum-iron cluster-binding protein [Firmicutes bacterium]|nr:NifB/NifX family molybdenum-iron cluster-binding protein [Bacillota bacterium]
MKIAVTAQGQRLDSGVNPRFGRAKWLVIYDLNNDTYEVMENRQNLEAAQGAGVQTASLIASSGASAVLTGNVGPKAFKVLQAAGIKTYIGVSGTVEQAITQYRTGSLVEASSPNVEGHWM